MPMEPLRGRVQRVQKVQRVQRVVVSPLRGDEYICRLSSKEALIKSLSDFILAFLFNARNKSTRIASYLVAVKKPPFAKIA